MKKLLYVFIIILLILCIGVIMILLQKIIIKSDEKSISNISAENQIVTQEINASEPLQKDFNNFNEEQSYFLEKIHLEIQESSISNTGLTLIVTDNNEKNVPWTDGYKVQKKINEEWIEIEPKNELLTSAFSYWKDENNQYKQVINWSYFYGELESGKYRIVKPIYNSNNNLYSNEFEIRE